MSAKNRYSGVAYHSALAQELEAEPLERFSAPGFEAFQHDLRNGPPRGFDSVDVIYAEPPWPAGFDKFNARAKIEGGTYAGLIHSIGMMVQHLGKPTYMITGAQGKRLLPEPSITGKIQIHNGGPVDVVGFNTDFLPGQSGELFTNFQFLKALAGRYDTVGYFCCGYGATGRVFIEAGKRAIVCDYNARCIGHIAKEFNSWNRPQ